jgi:hypothetical protein
MAERKTRWGLFVEGGIAPFVMGVAIALTLLFLR